MKIILAIVLVCGAAMAKPTEDKDATPLGDFNLSDVIAQTKTTWDSISTQFADAWNKPENQKLLDTVKEQSTAFTANLQNMTQQFTEKINETIKAKSPEFESMWNTFQKKVEDLTKDFNANVPNAQERIEQLRTVIAQNLKTVTTEAEKVSKNLGENSGQVQEDFAKLTKNFVEYVQSSTKKLKENLEAAAAQPQKS